MKLLNSGPNHQRPVIFRSLLYEACGRIINPIYGSVGLQWTGNWHSCQAAVESVLKGHPLQMEGPPDSPTSDCSDTKPSPSRLIDSILTDRPLKLRNRCRFKRSLHRKPTTHLEKLDVTTDSQACNIKWPSSCPKEFESMFQVAQEENQMKACNNKKITTYSVQDIVKAEATVEPAQVQGEVANEEAVEEIFYSNDMEIFSDDSHGKEIDENDVELELRLGSQASHEAVQILQDFKQSHRLWSSKNGCKYHPLPNFTSLSLALS
ncbi:hypothetical protein SUGI_0940640 [Cryptomeria japonica]|nr:hypothetical protein SUGI_0940640 [Cryptomeria japonica]